MEYLSLPRRFAVKPCVVTLQWLTFGDIIYCNSVTIKTMIIMIIEEDFF